MSLLLNGNCQHVFTGCRFGAVVPAGISALMCFDKHSLHDKRENTEMGADKTNRRMVVILALLINKLFLKYRL